MRKASLAALGFAAVMCVSGAFAQSRYVLTSVTGGQVMPNPVANEPAMARKGVEKNVVFERQTAGNLQL